MNPRSGTRRGWQPAITSFVESELDLADAATFNVRQKMKSAALSRGRVEGHVFLGGMAFMMTAFILWSTIASPNILRFLGLLPITVYSIWNFVASWRRSRGNFHLQWADQHAQIWNSDELIFDGDFSNMAQIDQDLRGYYLYPLNCSDVYRLKRSLVDDELQQVLDAKQKSNKSDYRMTVHPPNRNPNHTSTAGHR